MFAVLAKGVTRLGFGIALVFHVLLCNAAPGDLGEPLVFGLISPRSSEETLQNWRPLVDRLSKHLARKFEIKIYADQGVIVRDFVDEKIDLAWMGNSPALAVVEAGAGSVFAQMVPADGSVGYKSVLVVNKSSNLKSLGDVLLRSQTLSFSYGDSKSTSGNLVPSYYAFQKNGVESVAQVFKVVEIASHQENLYKVAAGKIDVGVANTEELRFFTNDHKPLSEQLKVIWESPVIPQSPLIVRDKLSPSLKNRIAEFITEFGKTAEEREILRAVNGLSRFRPSSNRQLVPIADLEMFKLRRAINSDQTLSEAQRTEKISQAIERGSKLELKLKLSRNAAGK